MCCTLRVLRLRQWCLGFASGDSIRTPGVRIGCVRQLVGEISIDTDYALARRSQLLRLSIAVPHSKLDARELFAFTGEHCPFRRAAHPIHSCRFFSSRVPVLGETLAPGLTFLACSKNPARDRVLVRGHFYLLDQLVSFFVGYRFSRGFQRKSKCVLRNAVHEWSDHPTNTRWQIAR